MMLNPSADHDIMTSRRLTWRRCRAGRIPVVAIFLGLTAGAPEHVQAQELAAIAGGAAGLVGGFIVTTSIFVAEARTGRFVYSVDDLATFRVEYLPVPIATVGGAVIGARDEELLGQVLLGSAVGLAGGAAAGWFVGGALWGGEEGKWAGAVIGGALGMVVGGTLLGTSFDSGPGP